MSKALELADEMARVAEYDHQTQAAAELRRLHAINAELLMALQGLHDDLMDYIKLNNLGAENNHWLVIARAAIANATKGTI